MARRSAAAALMLSAAAVAAAFSLCLLLVAAADDDQYASIFAKSKYLKVGYYDKSCPQAETIIRDVMANFQKIQKDSLPGILRVFFHDCFVRGCDGSIFLDPTPAMNFTEKQAIFSGSLHGYEIIDHMKERIEKVCPQTVSCADTIAFAARDSVLLSGGKYYEVPAGRKDGSISIAAETAAVPRPLLDIDPLIKSFQVKGLNTDDMVILSGSHSIGLVHCGTLNATRLHNFSASHDVDPLLPPRLAENLLKICPFHSPIRKFQLYIDPLTPYILDNKYYRLIQKGLGMMKTDQVLYQKPNTARLVDALAADNDYFLDKFNEAMIKMGNIDVKIDSLEGQIHTNCRKINAY